jgi:SAM-dependent methyltransferase
LPLGASVRSKRVLMPVIRGQPMSSIHSSARSIVSVPREKWDDFAEALKRDVIPFLPELMPIVLDGVDLSGKAALSLYGGSGTVAVQLALRGAEVVCSEEPQWRVDRLISRFREARIDSMKAILADANDLPLPGSSIYLAVWCVPMGTPRTLSAILGEVARVLRSDGMAVILVWSNLVVAPMPESLPVELYLDPIREAALVVGLTSMMVEEWECRCVAPNKRALLRAQASPFIPPTARDHLGLRSAWNNVLDRLQPGTTEVQASCLTTIVRLAKSGSVASAGPTSSP